CLLGRHRLRLARLSSFPCGCLGIWSSKRVGGLCLADDRVATFLQSRDALASLLRRSVRDGTLAPMATVAGTSQRPPRSRQSGLPPCGEPILLPPGTAWRTNGRRCPCKEAVVLRGW